MSIRLKLFLAFSVVLAFAVGVAAYGVQAVSNAEDLVVRLYDRPFMAVSYARAAQTKFSDARAAMERGWLLKDAARDSNDALLKAAMSELMEDLIVVNERLAQAGQVEQVSNTQRLVQDWYRIGSQLISRPTEILPKSPMLLNVLRKADALAAALDHLVENASEYGFRFRAQAKAEIAGSKVGLVTLAIAAVAAGVLFSLGIASSFGSAIRNAMAISERIASGNLSEKISISRRDELGRLLISLGQMQDALRTQSDNERLAADSKDRDNAEQVARRQRMEKEIADFRVSVGKVLDQTHEITGRMNLTANTLSMISAEASQQAKEAAGAAQETSSNVATVAASTEQLDASIREISVRLETATDVVGSAAEMADVTEKMVFRLAESAKRIDDVVSLIRSIAERTNLLALNATIEAARAGDAGRGFSVVASEVKALATQTARATEEISGQITEVQSSTSNAVDKIRSIVSVMKEINNLTMDISAGIQQQGAATQQIAQNIQYMANATKNVAQNVIGATSSISDTSRAASEVLETATYMTGHANELRESVDLFLQEVGAA